MVTADSIHSLLLGQSLDFPLGPLFPTLSRRARKGTTLSTWLRPGQSEHCLTLATATGSGLGT